MNIPIMTHLLLLMCYSCQPWPETLAYLAHGRTKTQHFYGARAAGPRVFKSD